LADDFDDFDDFDGDPVLVDFVGDGVVVRCAGVGSTFVGFGIFFFGAGRGFFEVTGIGARAITSFLSPS